MSPIINIYSFLSNSHNYHNDVSQLIIYIHHFHPCQIPVTSAQLPISLDSLSTTNQCCPFFPVTHSNYYTLKYNRIQLLIHTLSTLYYFYYIYFYVYKHFLHVLPNILYPLLFLIKQRLGVVNYIGNWQADTAVSCEAKINLESWILIVVAYRAPDKWLK